MPSINDILAFVGSVFAILIVLPMHEFAHAFAAVKCGDETPRVYGRYTLNPFKHFDLFGLISLLIVHFGWAKPVPINPVNFKHYRRDYFWVSVAGVLANLIGSFLFYPLSELMFLAAIEVKEIVFLHYPFLLISFIFESCFLMGLFYFVFNLIPVYPLDGFRVLEVALKPNNKFLGFLRQYGRYILFILIFWGFVVDAAGFPQLDFLGMFINWAAGWLAFPIQWFWGLIFDGGI